ncbi:MAG: hypothetical protein FWC43_12205 [Planctomycetaceae bacterium]|nr:hypothetical protein [Planctomycetaceae bacterium]
MPKRKSSKKKTVIDLDYEREQAIQVCRAVIAINLKADQRLVITAQKELNKLLGLYQRPIEAEIEATGNTNTDLDKIREHLEPLGLAPEGTPIVELARLAVSEIIHLKSFDLTHTLGGP